MESNDPEIVSVFFDEAQTYIESLNDGLLRLEGDLENVKRDKVQIDALFRAFHSIKGASGMLGFDRVNRLTHKSENLLEAIRSEKTELTPHVLQALFESLDALNILLEELKTNQQSCDLERILGVLDRVLEGGPVEKAEPPSPEMAKYLPAFLDETQDAIQAMESHLIEIENRVSKGDLTVTDDEVNVIFRSAHGVKGSAGAIGFKKFAELMHGVETILDGFRKKSIPLSGEIMETLLSALSTMKEMQQKIRDSGLDSVETRAIRSKITAILTRPDSAKPGPAAATQASDSLPALPAADAVPLTDQESEPSRPELKLVPPPAVSGGGGQNSGTPRKGWDISFEVAAKDPAPGVRAFLIANKVFLLGAVTQVVPALDRMAESPAGTVYQLNLQTDKCEAEIISALASEGAENIKCVHPLRRSGDESSPTKAVQTMRVDVERLDRLMNMSAEMVVNRARFVQIDTELREILEQNERGKAIYLSFQDAMQQSDLISTEIQKAIMDIRMVPIGPLFGRFKRVVRDISKENEKDIELVIRGEETEIDKKLIDELADPLTHLVRNCVDHGVETPEARKGRGKDPRGTVTLNAFQKGNKICITVSDDGKGIDCHAIRRKAVEKGICDEAGASAMSDHDAIQLIFHPGFSTAAKVTNISGRGVGMDIVKKKLEELRGSIEIQTTPGKGSEFILLLPLTLAIQKSLICDVNGTVFAIPLENVLEIVHAKEQKTYFVEDSEFILMREKVIPIKTMDGFFDGTAFRGKKSENGAGTLIVLFYKHLQTAVWVDRLLGQEDIVIRSFSRNLGEIAGLSGVTILGSGDVGLVLDAPGLLDPRTSEANSHSKQSEGEIHAAA